jgi:hypothetical protein
LLDKKGNAIAVLAPFVPPEINETAVGTDINIFFLLAVEHIFINSPCHLQTHSCFSFHCFAFSSLTQMPASSLSLAMSKQEDLWYQGQK